jgi:hypothetical protein
MDDIIKGALFFAAFWFFVVSPHGLKVPLLFSGFVYILSEVAQTGLTNRVLGLTIFAGMATYFTVKMKQRDDEEAAKTNQE